LCVVCCRTIAAIWVVSVESNVGLL
jgi:hypothetical protein